MVLYCKCVRYENTSLISFTSVRLKPKSKFINRKDNNVSQILFNLVHTASGSELQTTSLLRYHWWIQSGVMYIYTVSHRLWYIWIALWDFNHLVFIINQMWCRCVSTCNNNTVVNMKFSFAVAECHIYNIYIHIYTTFV